MTVPRLLRVVELAAVLVVVSLLAMWGLRDPDRAPVPGTPAPTPSAWSSPPLVLSGISLEQSEPAVVRVLGPPGNRSQVGPYRALEFPNRGQDGMTVVLLDASGRVMSIMAEQHSLSLAGKTLVQPGDTPQEVERYFGPPSQRGPDTLTWRRTPRDADDHVLFGELTVHFRDGRVSQVVLVKNMLTAP